jgi:hypothetical protein
MPKFWPPLSWFSPGQKPPQAEPTAAPAAVVFVVTPPPVPEPIFEEEIMKEERLTHCPETGKSLDGIKLRAYAENNWPAAALNANDPRCAEAIKRKKMILHEADLRDLDAKKAEAKTA